MNFNIKREKNQIIVCVNLEPKKMLGDKRIRVGMPTILDLIKNTPEKKLRLLGIIFLIIGFSIIWYIKS